MRFEALLNFLLRISKSLRILFKISKIVEDIRIVDIVWA